MILNIFEEELETYKKEITSLNNEKAELNNITLDNFFKKLNKEQKELMVNISPIINWIENDEEDTDIESMDKQIEKIINKPVERQKKYY